MVCDSSRRKRSPRSATGGRCGRRSSERCKRGVVSTGRLPGWNAEACCSDPATEPNGGVDSCRPLIGNGLRTGAPRRWALLGVGWFSELRYRSTAANAGTSIGPVYTANDKWPCIGAGARNSDNLTVHARPPRRSALPAATAAARTRAGTDGADVESVLGSDLPSSSTRDSAVLSNARYCRDCRRPGCLTAPLLAGGPQRQV